MPVSSIDKVQINTSISLLTHSKAYIEALLVSDSAKTCLGMGRELEISHDSLQKILDRGAQTEDEVRSFLLDMVKLYKRNNQKSFLVGDDTLVVKEFSELLEKLGLVNAWNKHDNHKGYKIVALLWTNGYITIPIDFRVWLDGVTPSKVDLMAEMIVENYKKVQFDMLLLDGLYPAAKMLNLLDSLSISFIMRLPKNRQICTTKGGVQIKIGDHWEFKLNKNTRTKRFEGHMHGKLRYITAHKQKNRNGEYKTRYLISNFKETAINILVFYTFRWTIEKLFRTIKQKLGLQDCLSRSIDGQKNHIWMVLVSYAIADAIKLQESYKTTDEAIRMIRKKYRDGYNVNDSNWRIFHAFA